LGIRVSIDGKLARVSLAASELMPLLRTFISKLTASFLASVLMVAAIAFALAKSGDATLPVLPTLMSNSLPFSSF